LIRGIVFDLFDTLVDQNHRRFPPVEVAGRRVMPTLPDLQAALRDRAGLRIPLERLAAELAEVDALLRPSTLDVGVELPTRDRFQALARRLDLADVEAVAESLTAVHMGALRAAVTVPDHHEAVLRTLAAKHPLGLCSNCSHGETARAVLAEAGFLPHLRSIAISEEVGVRKPRREIFEAVAAGLGLAPRELLHVGDSLSADVAGARSVGMKTVWLTRHIRDPEALLARSGGPGPDVALDDLRDLPVLIARFGAIA
jgi:FMN phosphatase YigB (HAD superfamily)